MIQLLCRKNHNEITSCLSKLSWITQNNDNQSPKCCSYIHITIAKFIEIIIFWKNILRHITMKTILLLLLKQAHERNHKFLITQRTISLVQILTKLLNIDYLSPTRRSIYKHIILDHIWYVRLTYLCRRGVMLWLFVVLIIKCHMIS